MAGRATVTVDQSNQITELGLEPSQHEVNAFRSSGVGVVRNLISQAEVESILAVVMDAADRGPVPGVSETAAWSPWMQQENGNEDDPLLRYPRMLHPHRADSALGRVCLEYLLDRRIWDLLRAVTGEEPLAAQSMFYFKPPGARGQGLHQDNNPLAVRPGTCMAAWIAMDRCDSDTGALSVVPGSGPLPLLCDAEYEDRRDLFGVGGSGASLKLPHDIEPVPAEMDPGDVLFFNGQVIHGSYPNTTADQWRRALIFHYASERCEEIAEFYHPLLSSDGSEVKRAASPEGGICGPIHERSAHPDQENFAGPRC